MQLAFRLVIFLFIKFKDKYYLIIHRRLLDIRFTGINFGPESKRKPNWRCLESKLELIVQLNCTVIELAVNVRV
jgi:hypothetical protein